ncbi:helix-turn-helix transcriptional regulator [Legionella fairfieldensis]|uniref:helix-turn-helix transcriptional regulator n=1 Tax=Legionella fairfieldensis TaxID=45064 RepID=UPI0013EF964F|nr:LuxR C-terminal-related transcriptional regulator [Legionella fairfieldensis]
MFKTHHTTLSISDLIAFTESPITCISIKNNQGYQYANHNFTQLMGHQSVKDILFHQDKDLTDNNALLKTIKYHDEWILENQQPLEVSEIIHPKNKPYLVKQVHGVLHPVFYQDEKKPRYVLGLFTPTSQLLSLTGPILFKLTYEELGQLLTKRSYSIDWQGMHFQLSRNDIQIIIGIVKGHHAGEIAAQLGLKQTTIETYTRHIKDKLGIHVKSELIVAVLETNLLSQILL